MFARTVSPCVAAMLLVMVAAALCILHLPGYIVFGRRPMSFTIDVAFCEMDPIDTLVLGTTTINNIRTVFGIRFGQLREGFTQWRTTT